MANNNFELVQQEWERWLGHQTLQFIMELPLLQPPLNKMTQSDLQKFIPLLICQSTGCKRPEYGKDCSRPLWWPKELPWSNPMVQPKATRSGRQAAESKKYIETLREAVKSCYQYHGKDYMLRPITRASKAQAVPPPPPSASPTPLPEEALSVLAAEPVSCASLPACSSHNGMSGPVEAAQPFQMVYICLCESEFPQKSELLAHQLVCDRRRDIENRNRHHRSPPREQYIQSRMLCYDAGDPITVSRVKFMETLGLCPPEKARKLGQRQGKPSNLHVDCEVIEIDDDSDVQIMSPPTPKTPKSLISQLSRDLSPTTRPRRYVNYCEERDDSDNESVDSSGENLSGSNKPRRNLHILSIDYCSPLGQRVKRQLEQSAHDQSKNNVDSDGEEVSPRSYEEYCSTPKKSHGNGMQQKLRNRPNMFPVTFKKSRKHCLQSCHMYKFTARQRYEFYRTKESGLDRRSRRLKQKYFKHKCSVRLERLSQDVIKKWTTRKPRPTPQYMYTNSGTKNTSLMSSEKQLQQLIALHNANRGSMALTPNNIQGSLQYRTQMLELHNSTNSLSEPVPTAIYRNQTPSPAANNFLRAMCNPQSVSTHHPNFFYGNNRTGGHHQFGRQRQGGGVNITRPNPRPVPQQTDPICIDSDEEEENIPSKDDVVSISSTESENSTGGSKKPKRNGHYSSKVPPKRARPEPSPPSSPMLLFKCHLCHAEITCKDNFASYIQSHFRQQHKVTNINLIEHTDASGHKVVSIVEEATESPSPTPPPPKHTVPDSMPSKRKLFRDKPGPLHSKLRQRDAIDGQKEVICLD